MLLVLKREIDVETRISQVLIRGDFMTSAHRSCSHVRDLIAFQLDWRFLLTTTWSQGRIIDGVTAMQQFWPYLHISKKLPSTPRVDKDGEFWDFVPMTLRLRPRQWTDHYAMQCRYLINGLVDEQVADLESFCLNYSSIKATSIARSLWNFDIYFSRGWYLLHSAWM